MSNIIANWPALKKIQALTTTRRPGHSLPPYDQNNMGLHVGDIEAHVLANRRNLIHTLSLPAEPIWLEQIHSNTCVVIEEDSLRTADAAITRHQEVVLAVMTADCLPIVLCNQQGTEIAAIHAGWRGLANGIIENTLKKMHSPPETILAWIGPAICATCFEIGAEVRQTYLQQYPYTQDAFIQKNTKQYANLPLMAELILRAQGISGVYHAEVCTYEQHQTCYSYRRESQTGRMVTLIWITQTNTCH